jgi:hypothetical protein
VSPAELLAALMRTAERHYADRDYNLTAYTLEQAAACARECAKIERRRLLTLHRREGKTLTLIRGGDHAR